MKREDTYSVRASVTWNGRTEDLGVWDKQSGGAVDTASNPYRPGGLADQIDLGGTRTWSPVQITKLYDETLNALEAWLDDAAGKAVLVVTKQPTDAEGVAYGRPKTYRCRLKASTPPNVDSASSSPALHVLDGTVLSVS